MDKPKPNFDSPAGRCVVACFNIKKETGHTFYNSYRIFMNSPRGAEMLRVAEKEYQESKQRSGGK